MKKFSEAMNEVQQQVASLYREQFGKMVASLLYSSSNIDPELAEDLVQDTFSAALTDWEQNGIPYNPKAWLYKVCKNKAINRIKRDARLEALSEKETVQEVEQRFSESLLDDQQLKLLFACAHPDLSPKIQVVITLKYVANLRVEAIANVLGMTIDGVDKLLVRARQKIKNEKILLTEPTTEELAARLPVVHKVIYLLFNEGYRASAGKDLMREELCEEALIITRQLMGSPLPNEETMALYALMLFNAARFEARFGKGGELLDLEQQDRSRWNQQLIALGSDYLTKAETKNLSTYHLEASIAYFHCTSPTFSETPWRKIVTLYARLLDLHPNPFIELNYAIALFYNGDTQNAFEILLNLRRHTFLNRSYLLHATLGKLYYLHGDKARAKEFLCKATENAQFERERKYIEKLIEKI
ncbi:sigma-70 family RNA polymerase sigma factor [uncultured Imperialibacter sp.]|uniref:RNA polymerase sigma factor n=1 Tax=uncultured Imperialibacter sp. TaxID=1672639 RepID=UPI0030DB83DD